MHARGGHVEWPLHLEVQYFLPYFLERREVQYPAYTEVPTLADNNYNFNVSIAKTDLFVELLLSTFP